MAILSPSAKQKFFKDDGTPAAGYKLYTYAAGTTTPIVTYTDSTGTSTNTNPIILDSRGEANIWLLNLFYKYDLKTPDGTTVDGYPVDNISYNGGAQSGDASTITYTANGSGAEQYTVKEKLDQFVTPYDYGAVGDGSTDDTVAVLNAASECLATNKTLLFTAGRFRTLGVSIARGVNCLFLGGVLEPASTYTVSIAGTVIAAPVKIFGGAGTCKFITSGTSDTGYTYSEWWGAVANNDTDCYAAMQNAINNGIIGSKIYLQNWLGYRLTQTIQFTSSAQCVGITGAEGSLITAIGSAFTGTKLILVNDGARDFDLINFNVGLSSGLVDYGIFISDARVINIEVNSSTIFGVAMIGNI